MLKIDGWSIVDRNMIFGILKIDGWSIVDRNMIFSLVALSLRG